MTKKPAEKSQDIKAEPAQGTTAVETWQPHWNVARRLLEMRRKLRGTKLWKTFELQRSFEAFSIHSLADEIEAVACDCGLISSFKVTKWDKLGNKTIVEGVVCFENVDDGEVREYAGVGEAIDNGDKGLHKADSDARKIALINSLNLGIGSDKETEDKKAEGDAMSGSMGGKPQQRYTPPEPTAKPNGNGHANGHAVNSESETYTLEQRGLKARAVLGKDLTQTVWTILVNSPTASAIDDFVNSNLAEFNRFFTNDPKRGEAMNQIITTRREDLVKAGRA
jgi:hypothetical protein